MNDNQDVSFSKEEEALKLAKLQAEIDKIKAETKSINTSPFKQPSTWIPLLTAVMGIITTSLGWYNSYTNEVTASQKLDASQSSEKSVESYNSGLLSRLGLLEDQLENYATTIDSLQTTRATGIDSIKQSNLPLDTFIARKIAIQFQSVEEEPLVKGLQEVFNNSGIPTTPPEKIEGSFSNSIRYFYATDYAIAKQIVNTTKRYYTEKGCSIEIEAKFLELNTDHVKNGTIEIWLNQPCPTPN